MTQVSRFPLSKTLEDQMHSLFRRALATLTTEQDIGEFLDDLLSPTEKVMLGKRLAIAILLDKGYDQRTIHNIMKVSVTTVNTVNFWLKQKGKGYYLVLSKLKKQKEWQQFKVDLEETLKVMFSERRQREYLRGYIPRKREKEEIL
jgi:uncharacterized protein YerC